MAAFLDGCRFNPAAGGTTDWTYSSAVTGYQSPAAANIVNGRLYKYRAESADLSQWEFGEGAYNTSTGVLARTTVLYNSSGTTSKISFSTIPQVAIVALKEDLLTPDEANTFSAAQQAQLRSNLGISTEVGKIEFWPTTTLHAGRLVANGQSISRTTYPALLAYLVASGTATFTSGSSTVGMASHNRQVGDPIKLFTSSALPTNFTAGTHGLPAVGTNYFVTSVIDANNVTLSATAGGSAIAAGSAGSGTQTWVNAPFGDGDGSTTFTVPDLRGGFVRGWDYAAGVDTNRVIGSLQTDAFQGHAHQLSDTTDSFVYVRGSSGVAAPAAGSSWDRTTLSVGVAITDGTNGTPRTSAETRPRNVALLATIRYSA
jgi:hypothetical protein